MELRAKIIDISTGDSPIVVMTHAAAITHDLHTGDRVQIVCVERNTERKVIATVNTTVSTGNGLTLRDDQLGMFFESAKALGLAGPGVEEAHDARVSVIPAPKPASIGIIRKKMDGQELTDDEILTVVKDIVDSKLTQVELTYFVAACSIFPLTFREIGTLTKSMSETGLRLHFDKPLVIDKHCIGGVPNNRTSMITIPIMASLGYTVPKTSSRAITSPAGTADTMEVLADVNIPVDKMRNVVDTVGACLVWGGSVNLAPADDKIIRIERPLSIDVAGLMLSSVMAKKYSVGSTHVVIDIPYGEGAKVPTLEKAEELRKSFQTIGKLLGMKMLVLTTDGSQPIGNGIGPLLECYDVMAILQNEPSAPQDLREKSIMIAGRLLEFIGHCKKGEGAKIAREEIASGRAWRKFNEIIDAQGRKILPPLGKYTHHVFATTDGVVKRIDNIRITKIARIAGAPLSKNAGLLLYCKKDARVKAGDRVYTVYADNEDKLATAVQFIKENGDPYTIG